MQTFFVAVVAIFAVQVDLTTAFNLADDALKTRLKTAWAKDQTEENARRMGPGQQGTGDFDCGDRCDLCPNYDCEICCYEALWGQPPICDNCPTDTSSPTTAWSKYNNCQKQQPWFMCAGSGITCFHESTQFLDPTGNGVSVADLKIGDTIMVVLEEDRANNLTEPAALVEGKIVGWSLRPAEGSFEGCDDANDPRFDYVEIKYEFAGSAAEAGFNVTHSHYIRVNTETTAGTADNLVLASEVAKGDTLEIWDPASNEGSGGLVVGTVTEVRTFEDHMTMAYSPITDKGTNFVIASGAVVPFDGKTLIADVEVHRDYIIMLHNGFLTAKSFVPAAIWDTVAAPALNAAPSQMYGPCVETSEFFNNIYAALLANDNEGLSLVSDPDKSAEVLAWVADNIFAILGATDDGTWSLQSAVTASVGLALKAATQVAYVATGSAGVAIDVNVDDTCASSRPCAPRRATAYLTSPGQQCPAGHAIVDKEECKAAFSNFIFHGEKPSRNRAYGCYLAGNKVFYNPTPVSKRKVWKQSKGICRSPDFETTFAYKEAEKKGRNCAAADKIVDDANDCKKAANALGKSYKRSHTSKTRPAGCYFRGNKAWFNTRTTVYAKGRYGKFTGVCRTNIA